MVRVDYRLFCMAMSQRWVSVPPKGLLPPTASDSVGIFDLFYDRNGPREAFKREWHEMKPQERQSIRLEMEAIQERMMANLRVMPPQLMLIFRYFSKRGTV